MNYIEINKAYIREKIGQFKKTPIRTTRDVYLAKQLRKLIDDLDDEGYFALHQAVDEFDGYEFLTDMILTNRETPFLIEKQSDTFQNASYGGKMLLEDFIEKMIAQAKKHEAGAEDEKLCEIRNYCEWLYRDRKDAAFLFLLRDAFLPYLYFREVKECVGLYPAIIGRHFFDYVCKKKSVDDEIRLILLSGLKHAKNMTELKQACRSDMDRFLHENREIHVVLKKMLDDIPAKRIITVESGVHGTFPFLIAMIDDRVEIRLYTCVMYLQEVYSGLFYTEKYENNRLFETMLSQDKLFVFDSYKNDQFFVRECEDRLVKNRALTEIRQMISGR